MGLTVTIIGAGVLLFLLVLWVRHYTNRDELRDHRITAEQLHDLIDAHRDILVYDVRQPLDLLANLEIIPGAKRIPPKEILENPGLIPREKDSVIYCTCPSDKTSREILHLALSLHFSRIKFLSGGLAAWKEKGYPVQQYTETFHLDTAT